jgi:hypothetical protein
MRPIQTLLGIGRERIEDNGGGGEFKYDILDIL